MPRCADCGVHLSHWDETEMFEHPSNGTVYCGECLDERWIDVQWREIWLLCAKRKRIDYFVDGERYLAEFYARVREEAAKAAQDRKRLEDWVAGEEKRREEAARCERERKKPRYEPSGDAVIDRMQTLFDDYWHRRLVVEETDFEV